MHLVGFTIEMYYDARPYERQMCRYKNIYCNLYRLSIAKTSVARITQTQQIK